MSDNVTSLDETPDSEGSPPPAPTPPRRGPGHRGQDVRDTMAEMAAKAHEISLEAGSKMASAMRDVIGAAAGLTAFAIESARDLVQYMVRRGQMTQDEADKLMRDVEVAHGVVPKPVVPPPPPPVESPRRPPAVPTAEIAVEPHRAAPAKPAPAAAKSAPAPAAKAPAAAERSHSERGAKANSTKPVAKKVPSPPAKKPAKVVAKKPAPKPAPRGASKKAGKKR